MKKKITADRARQLFSYNPETGALIRSVTTSSQAVAGSTPGWVNKAGYIALNIDAGCYLLHRVAWLITHGEWPCGVIDHKNQDRLDNRLDNLRDVTRQVNTQNNRLEKAGKKYGSSLAGANWDAYAGRWKSSICVDGRHIHLGRFDSEQAAHSAYLTAKQRLHKGCVQ